MKFWKKLQFIGSVVVLVLGVLALIASLLQSPTSHGPTSGSPASAIPAPQQAGTQGL